jgi:hypothetical protein
MQDLNQHKYEHQPIDDKEYRAGAAPVTHCLPQKERCTPKRYQCGQGQEYAKCHIDEEFDVQEQFGRKPDRTILFKGSAGHPYIPSSWSEMPQHTELCH